MWGWRGGGRQRAGATGGRAHLHGLADEAHVGASLLSAWACMPASTRVCMQRAAKGAQGNLARRAPGIGQQVHAAGLGSRRAAGARCVVGSRASAHAAPAPRGLGDFLRVCGQFERDHSKRPLSSQIAKSLAARAGVLPVLPTTQRAPAARLLPNPAACTCCLMPGARLARFPWAPFATRRMHTRVLAGMQAHALSRDAPTCFVSEPVKVRRPCHRSRLPLPPTASPTPH
jgi:hypothetical protein